MSIKFRCQCGKRYNVSDKLGGRNAKCKTCGNPLLVPMTTPAESYDAVASRPAVGNHTERSGRSIAAENAEDEFGFPVATVAKTIGEESVGVNSEFAAAVDQAVTSNDPIDAVGDEEGFNETPDSTRSWIRLALIVTALIVLTVVAMLLYPIIAGWF